MRKIEVLGFGASYVRDLTVLSYGPLNRYIKLQIARAPGMPGTFSRPLTLKETAG